MELSLDKIVRVSQKEIAEAVLGAVFKKNPELRPSGMEGSDEFHPQVHFEMASVCQNGIGVMALIILESKREEIVKP